MRRLLICLSLVLALGACERKSTSSNSMNLTPPAPEPEPVEITSCYSGGKVIYQGKTINTLIYTNSGVVSFTDAKSGTKMFVYGDCVLNDIDPSVNR